METTSMQESGTLILTRADITRLIDIEEYIAAVQQAFQLHGKGKSMSPGVFEVPVSDGAFHIKAAGLKLPEGDFVAVKVNANFPDNLARFSLPTIQGTITLFNAGNGYPLAVLDSSEITAQRTAAATAIAAKYLARPESSTLTICGCGKQGRIQLLALQRMLPINQVYAFDRDQAVAQTFAEQFTQECGITVSPTYSLEQAALASDVIVTCTTSPTYILSKDFVNAGTFVAGVGADNPHKQELDPRLFVGNKIVADIIDQAAGMGDLRHAVDLGLVKKEDVYAELAEIVTGRKAGRENPQEITIFDSTGTAIQDVAAAVAVYLRAKTRGLGYSCQLI